MAKRTTISFRADISNLRKQLEQIPGVTDTQAKRMVARLTKQLKAAERESTKAWKAARKKGPDKYRKSIDALGPVFSAVIAGVGVASLKRLGDAAVNTALEINTIAKEARTLQADIEEYQRVQGVFDQLTGSTTSAATSFAYLAEKIDEARRPGTEAARTFEAMGIEIESFARLGMAEQLLEIQRGMERLPDRAARTAAAVDLLGRAGRKLGPAFEDMDAITEAMEQTTVVSAEMGLASEQLADDVLHLSQQWRRAKSEALEPLLPAMSATTVGLQEMLDEAERTGAIEDLATALLDLGGAMSGDLPTSIGTFGHALARVADAASVFLTAGRALPDLLYDFYAAVATLNPAFDRTLANFERLKRIVGLGTDEVEDFTVEVTDGGEQVRWFGDQLAWTADIQSALRDAVRDTTPALAQQTAEVEAGISAWARWAAASEQARVEFVQNLERENAELERSLASRLSQRIRFTADSMSLEDRWAEYQEAKLAAAVEAALEAEAAVQSATEDLVGSSMWAMQTFADLALDAMIETGRELTERQKEQALTLFYVSKAAAIAQASINAALAISNAIANAKSWQEALIAGAAIGVTAGAQIAVIAAEQPPQFDIGGLIPGPAQQRTIIDAQPGEAVLNRQAASNLGGETIAKLNAGAPLSERFIAITKINNRIIWAQEHEAIRTGRSPYMRQIAMVQPQRTGLRVLETIE